MQQMLQTQIVTLVVNLVTQHQLPEHVVGIYIFID